MILERSDELEALDRAIGQVQGRDGCLVVIEGQAGIGKTTILDAALELAAAAGVRALRTTGSELEQSYAYGVAISLFEPLIRSASLGDDSLFDGVAGAARGLFTPQAEPVPVSGGAFAKILGLYWLALNAAEANPILLVVDDAQWADGASLRFCDYLARRLEGVPIGLVLAFRSDVAAADEEAAWALRNRRSAMQLRPRPLSEAAVGTLLATLGEDGSDPDLRRACWTASAGNPFFVTELIETLRGGSAVDAGANGGDVALPVPDRIMRQIEGRVSRLDRTARRVAEAFAILDDQATVRRLATLVGVSDEQSRDTLADLARAAILTDTGSMAFTHPVVREAVYRLTPEPIRGHLHREAGQLLQREGAPLGVAAGHLLVAERSADPRVVAILCDAARQARERGDAAVAVTYLRRALEEPPEDSRRDALLIELARAEAALAAPSAVDHFKQAVNLVEDPRIKAQLLLDQGYAQVNAADWAGAVTTFEKGAQLVHDGPPELRSRLEVGALSAAWLGTDRRVEQLRRAEEILASRPLGREDRELAIWIAYQRAAAGMSTSAELTAEAHRTMESAPIDDLVADARTIELTAGSLLAVDALPEEIDLLSRSISAAEQIFAFGKVGIYSEYRAWPNYFSGELASAIADAETALRIADLGWDIFHPACCALLMNALIERAELDAADDVSALEDARWAGRIDAATMIPIARGRLHLERDQIDDALVELGKAREACAAIGRRLQVPMDWRTWMIEALVRAGRRDEARDIAAEMLTIAHAWGARWPLGVATRAAGVAEGGTSGIETLRQAVAILETTPARLELARALVTLGAMLRRQGSLNDARTTLARAMDLAHRSGATRLARRAREELKAAGSRPRRYVVGGVESLTPAERRVAELAADGRTNREVAQALFVTPKAVEFHLANAYRKLQIGSRRELSTALRSIA